MASSIGRLVPLPNLIGWSGKSQVVPSISLLTFLSRDGVVELINYLTIMTAFTGSFYLFCSGLYITSYNGDILTTWLPGMFHLAEVQRLFGDNLALLLYSVYLNLIFVLSVRILM